MSFFEHKYLRRSQRYKKSRPAKRNGNYLSLNYKIYSLFELSEVLNGANHLRSVRVLIVVPSNNLYERVAITNLRNHGLVIPELNGKLIGAAQRVPTPTGSTTILHAVVKGEVTVEGINAAMKAATNESFGYTEEKLVSSDIIGMKFGSLFDANQTMVSKIGDGNSLVQVVAWYDNENSYTSQMVRTIKYLAELK